MLYILLVCVGVSICMGAFLVWKPAERACLSCGEATPIQDGRCRHCGFSPRSG